MECIAITAKLGRRIKDGRFKPLRQPSINKLELVNTLFEHRITVSKADIDELGHVNNVVYVRYVQEVAAAHWLKAASISLQERYAWVVLRHEIDYRNPAFLNEEIIGQTWVGDYNGARFDRFVKLVAANTNKTLVEAKTSWCMLDARTMRPTRITPEVIEIIR
jgi:acyl-CoA thioester hydrolase